MSSKLGEFVRACRERIQPESLGLPQTFRRRTPGLRREELATLCGVSSTWITWLEQGRPVSASAKTLTKLADVLHLSKAERKYLFSLADKVDPAAESITPGAVNAHAVQEIVKVIQAPAYVLDRRWNAIAWNRRAQELFSDWLGPRNEEPGRNLLTYMFVQPAAKTFVADWSSRARRLVAEFRADCGKAVDTQPLKELIEILREKSKDFAKLWAAQDVVMREGGEREFAHPVKGRLKFNQVTMQLQGRPDLKLTILIPLS